MVILKDLMKIELINVRSRILGFWGIYFTLGILFSLFWFKSLPTQEKNVNSFLQLGLEANVLDIILHTPFYPLLFSFCVTLLGPFIILLFTDMIPTEIASGQLLVLKTSGTDLQKIYNVRIILILLSGSYKSRGNGVSFFRHIADIFAPEESCLYILGCDPVTFSHISRKTVLIRLVRFCIFLLKFLKIMV